MNTWATNLELVRSKIPDDELKQAPPDTEYTGPPDTSTGYRAFDWLPSLSHMKSPTPHSCADPQSGYASSQTIQSQSETSGDSDSNQTAPQCKRKRDFSQVTASSPDPSSKPRDSKRHRSGPRQQHTTQFCTQRCLLGIKQGGILNENCPNVDLHKKRGNRNRHPITAQGLVQQLKQQLNNELDQHFTYLGHRGEWTHGAPFKIVCA